MNTVFAAISWSETAEEPSMARKRSRIKASSNNPSTVLIIFLVFFILLSIGLGVWGYLKAKTVGEKDKELAAGKEKATKDQNSIDYHQLKYLWMKGAAGHELGKNAAGADEANQLQDLVTRFEEGKFDAAAGSDKAAFEDVVNKDKVNLGGARLDAQGKPVPDPQKKKVEYPNYDDKTKQFKKGHTYFANWKTYTTTIADLQTKNKTLTEERETLAAKDKVRQKANDTAWNNLNSRVTNAIKGATDAAAAYETAREKTEKAEKDARSQVEEAVKKELGTIDKELNKQKAEVAKLKEEFAKTLKEKDDRIARLMVGRTQAEDSGKGEKTAQVDLVKYDSPKGKIVRVDWTGKMPYIDLGSADGVKEQLTFSVYARSADGKEGREPKGSLEVIKILGPHLAQARVSYMRDASAEPIVEGDLVYNPLWDPNHKTHVAIAGVVDFTGQEGATLQDQVRNLQEFMNNLKKQNIEVDAWLDLQSNAIQGQITLKTDYFILAEGPTYDSQSLNLKDEKVNFKQKTSEMMEVMRKQAFDKGVTIIPLRKFTLLTGYRVPRTVRSAWESESRPETAPAKEKEDEEEKPKKDEKKNGKKLGDDDEKMNEKKGAKKDDDEEKEEKKNKKEDDGKKGKKKKDEDDEKE
jgi:hypothetical protein